MDKYIGYFTKREVVFRDEDNGFTITSFICEDSSLIKIKGTFSDIPDGFIEIAIKSTENTKYGVTHIVWSYKPFLPREKNSVITYLEKYLNLTNNQATKVFNHYKDLGLDTFNGLDTKPEAIDDIPQLFTKKEKKQDFLEKKEQEKNMREVRFFLYDYGFSENQAKQIIKVYQTDSLKRIKENPYSLLNVEWITFNMIDKLFFDNGGERTYLFRILWGMVYFLRQYVNSTKNIYLEYSTYKNYIQEKLGLHFTDENFGAYLVETSKPHEGYKSFDKVIALDIADKGIFIILHSYFMKTKEIAKNVCLLMNHQIWSTYKLSEEDKTLDNGGLINEDQVKAIENSFNKSISMITGYWGTGKSTIIKKIIDIAEKRKETYVLLAPTGKAVDVLISVTKRPEYCSTIHRRLEILDNENSEVVMLTENIVLVDESSMQDFNLMYLLFKASSFELTKKRIIIMGDDNQLKPVGVGAPFLDLINSKLIPLTKLTKIYRQKEWSSILDNSKKVIEGTTLNYETTVDWETINILGMSDPKIRDIILDTVKKNGWKNERDVIISAKYKGEAGINKLNEVIQDYVQRKNTYIYKKGLHTFYLGDRVMNISKNIYEEDEWRILALPSYMMVEDKYGKILKSLTWYMRLPSKNAYYNPKTEKIITETEGKYFLEWEKEDGEYIQTRDTASYQDLPDRNVYNWNWWIIEAIKTEEGWFGYNSKGEVKPFVIDASCLEKGKKEYIALVNFGDKYFFYERKELNHLSLFYASTVHKMQGSQFHTVYGICSPRDSFMTDKNWLYTMISRTQEQIYYFSTSEATIKSQHNKGEDRNSFLPEFIKLYNKQLKGEEKKKKD